MRLQELYKIAGIEAVDKLPRIFTLALKPSPHQIACPKKDWGTDKDSHLSSFELVTTSGNVILEILKLSAEEQYAVICQIYKYMMDTDCEQSGIPIEIGTKTFLATIVQSFSIHRNDRGIILHIG